MKKKIIFIGILLLIVSLVGFLVLKVLYKKAERNVATENAIRIDPSNFAALFKNFEDSANKIYINKTIELTGIATSVTNNQTSQTDITVKINDSLPFINCTIDGLYKSINQLDTVTIKGICTGLLTTINLKNCIVVVSKKYSGTLYPLETEKKAVQQSDTTKNKKTLSPVVEPTEYFKTQKAQITFDAGSGLEDIKAINNAVEATIDIIGNVRFKLAMLQFKFADALMEEHFNEEYVESSKFPIANFAGKIINTNEVTLGKDGTYNATIKGLLTIHGKTKETQTTALLIVKNQTIKATATIKIILADFNVKSAAADEAELKITATF